MKYWGDCIQDMNRPLRFLLSLTDWCVTEKLGHFNIKKKVFLPFGVKQKALIQKAPHLQNKNLNKQLDVSWWQKNHKCKDGSAGSLFTYVSIISAVH